MKSAKQIGCVIDRRICEGKLPVGAPLKVIDTKDSDYGLSEDEIQDRNEFIRCYLLRDCEPLMRIPKQEGVSDFFIADCTVDEAEYSAFNTVDYQRTQRPFNKYHYAMRMILERVKDLAILHSCISSAEDRKEVLGRYEALLEREFRARLAALVRRYKTAGTEEDRQQLQQRIAEINRRIIDCKKVWERYAPPENWDR